MRFQTKPKIGAGIIMLVCVMALPYAKAQTGARARIIQLNPDGGAYLGIHMEDVTAGNMAQFKLSKDKGVIVRSVVQGSPAEAAGIQDDDVILEFDGYVVRSTMQFARLVRETPVGREVALVASRDGKRINLTVRLAERERAQANPPNIPDLWRLPPDSDNFQFRLPDLPGGSSRGILIRPANRKPRLGITVQPLTDQLAEFFGVPEKKGVLVASVSDGSPSAGKLQSGDVIISVNGKGIQRPEDLTEFIGNSPGGDISIGVIREKKQITVVVPLPEDNSDYERGGFRL